MERQNKGKYNKGPPLKWSSRESTGKPQSTSNAKSFFIFLFNPVGKISYSYKVQIFFSSPETRNNWPQKSWVGNVQQQPFHTVSDSFLNTEDITQCRICIGSRSRCSLYCSWHFRAVGSGFIDLRWKNFLYKKFSEVPESKEVKTVFKPL